MWLLERGHINKNYIETSPQLAHPWKLARRPDPPDLSGSEKQSEFPQDPDLESDSEVIIKASSQSPKTSDTEATFHTLPKNQPFWTEGSVGSALQIIEGRKPTFTTQLLERTHLLFSIFSPDHLIR